VSREGVLENAREAVAEAQPLADLLSAVVAFVCRFVVLTREQADTVALWVIHTHTFGEEYPDTTPYLGVTSAEKRSGKTLLLEVLELLVRAPLMAANISDAALFRAVQELKPTLFWDEIDAIFGPKSRGREDLRGLLNAGYRRGAVAYRMGGANMTTLTAYAVFCAKAFAGIGRSLPETTADRTITLAMTRKMRGEGVERFRRRAVSAAAVPLKEALEASVPGFLAEIQKQQPELPNELDDRAQDIWEPLLAIADVAGEGWPERARAAAKALSAGEGREDESRRVQLLAAIKEIFEAKETDRLSTHDLIWELSRDAEAPWAEWWDDRDPKGPGKPERSAAQKLAAMLRPFGIRSRSIRLSETDTPKGFLYEQFEDAFSRYLPATPATPPQPASGAEGASATDPPQTRHTASPAVAGVAEGNEDPPQREAASEAERGAVADRGAGTDDDEVWECPKCSRLWSPRPPACKCGQQPLFDPEQAAHANYLMREAGLR
jgi:hypothetical protein